MEHNKSKEMFSILSVVLISLISGCVSEEALPYHSQNECWGPYECADTSLSLGLLGSGCGGSLTYAEDEDGNFWRFDSTCLPGGFKETNKITESIAFAPRCDE